LSSLKVLFKVFTDNGNICKKLFILDLSCDVKASLNVTKFDAGPGDPSKTLDIVPFYNGLFDGFKVGVDDRFLKLLESLGILPLRLSLNR
jgi:hypothetical protein